METQSKITATGEIKFGEGHYKVVISISDVPDDQLIDLVWRGALEDNIEFVYRRALRKIKSCPELNGVSMRGRNQ